MKGPVYRIPRGRNGRTPRDGALPAAEFKARCLELMDRVRETGVEYVITKHGRPVAKLVPYAAPERRAFFGSGQGTVLQGLAAEFVALGLLAGLVAAAGAGGLAWLIATRVFELDYLPGASLVLVGLGAGAAIVGLSGTLALRKVVTTRPLASLRGF